MLLCPLADVHQAVLVTQASHAWLAWQLADHWGNRRFARPAPRPEVLAAVQLQAIGFCELDERPTLDPGGRPSTLAGLPDADLVAAWRSSLRRLALCSRYAALLAAAHFEAVAASRSHITPSAELDQFLAGTSATIERWQGELTGEARYQPFLEGPTLNANLRLLAASLELATRLCGGPGEPFTVEVCDADGEPLEVLFSWLDRQTLRGRPWPFAGDRVRVRCEGKLLGRLELASQAELEGELARAPSRRLETALLRSSAHS